MIGNASGIDGVVDSREFRIFSEPNFPDADERLRTWRRFYGGEVDGPSRQLARYVERTTRTYLPQLDPMMIYRLDRFGRGGHHRPFNDAGFAGVRIMEAHEHYDRQHQDIRTADGRAYGDVLAGVDFDYAARLTAVNAVALASLGWAPPAPTPVEIGGTVEPAARLAWEHPGGEGLAGFKLYYRLTTAPQWTDYVWVGPEAQGARPRRARGRQLLLRGGGGRDGREREPRDVSERGDADAVAGGEGRGGRRDFARRARRPCVGVEVVGRGAGTTFRR